MGQYWIPVNLDKKEFIHPHTLGSGLKAVEQLNMTPGTQAALMLLLTAMPEPRGGGDFDFKDPDTEYRKIAHSVIGRWAGDRIAIVGDYAEPEDLDTRFHAHRIYGAVCSTGLPPEQIRVDWGDEENPITDEELAWMTGWTDISDQVAKVIEHQFEGFYHGSGWRDFTPHHNTPR